MDGRNVVTRKSVIKNVVVVMVVLIESHILRNKKQEGGKVYYIKYINKFSFTYYLMPRRRQNRKRKREIRQLNYRAGKWNAAGGVKISPNSRTIKTITCTQFGVVATTAGDTMAFNIVDWSAPATPESGGTFLNRGDAANLNPKPHNHVEVLADGYDTARVISALYRFHVRYIATDSGAKDFIFAYRFSTTKDSGYSSVFTAGNVTIDFWKELRQSYGWVYHRMSSTHAGGSEYPSTKTIDVRIPSIIALTRKLHNVTTEIGTNEMSHAITIAVDSAEVDLFLHVMIMGIDGTGFVANDVIMDLDVYQHVKVRKLLAQAELIKEQSDEDV